jgi:hypothetical protein
MAQAEGNMELKERLRRGLEHTRGFTDKAPSLVPLPVPNDARHLAAVLDQAHRYAETVLCMDEKRSFGGSLGQADTRFDHYRDMIERSIQRVA